MSTPTNPTAEEILIALAVLQRAPQGAWDDAVGYLDGIDDRLANLAGLSDALVRMSRAVEADALAIAEGHKDEAERYAATGHADLAGEQYGLAFHHEVLATKAGTVEAHAEIGLERWRDLESAEAAQPTSMTLEQYEAAQDAMGAA